MPSGPDPPNVPNPQVVAQQQQQLSKDAMLAGLAGSMTGQKTDYGSLGYAQSGTDQYGNPMYTATTNLSPQQKALLQVMQGTQAGFGTAGQNILGSAGYGDAPDLSNASGSLTNEMLSRQDAYMDPYRQKEREDLDNQLRNQGIMPGTEGYNRAVRPVQDNQARERGAFLNTAQGQAFQQAKEGYQFPAEMAAKMMQLGGPADLPSKFVQTPQAAMKPADLVGATDSANKANMSVYNAEVQKQMAMMQGIAGIGGAAIGAPVGTFAGPTGMFSTMNNMFKGPTMPTQASWQNGTSTNFA